MENILSTFDLYWEAICSCLDFTILISDVYGVPARWMMTSVPEIVHIISKAVMNLDLTLFFPKVLILS